jgi:hypothetical protein
VLLPKGRSHVKGRHRARLNAIRETQARLGQLAPDPALWDAKLPPDTLEEALRDAHGLAPGQIAGYVALKARLLELHARERGLIDATVDHLAHAIAAVARHHAGEARARGLPFRVHFEDLKWSKASAKGDAGYWLAHNQRFFFHAAVIERVAGLCRRHGHKVEIPGSKAFVVSYVPIPVTRVDARRTSQRCSACGHAHPANRAGKKFRCHNPAHHHTTAKGAAGKRFELDADLNAARNVALAPPGPLRFHLARGFDSPHAWFDGRTTAARPRPAAAT